MIAESRPISPARTREGLALAKAKGRLRGKPPKLKPTQEAHLVKLWRAGSHTTLELAELFSVSRATVYRAIGRAEPAVRAGNRGELVSGSFAGAVQRQLRGFTPLVRFYWCR